MLLHLHISTWKFIYTYNLVDKLQIILWNRSLHAVESDEFLSGRSHPILMVESKGHAVHAFVNQKLQGDQSWQILMNFVHVQHIKSKFSDNSFAWRWWILILAFGSYYIMWTFLTILLIGWYFMRFDIITLMLFKWDAFLFWSNQVHYCINSFYKCWQTCVCCILWLKVFNYWKLTMIKGKIIKFFILKPFFFGFFLVSDVNIWITIGLLK